MTSVKHFLYQHRIFFGLFFFLLIYEIVIGNNLEKWEVNEHFITFYTVDFGLGFCSRFLPGAVYRFLFHDTSVFTASVFAAVLTIIFFIGICILLEKLLLRVSMEHRPLCLFFVLLFLVGPASVSLYVRWLGVLDFYWVFFTLAFFFFIAHKRLYFLIPPLFVLSVFVHYGAMVCYIPMMAILLLYKISVTDDKTERKILWTVFSLSVAFAVFTTLYFLFFEKQNLVYPVEDFNRILIERGANYTYYYDYDLYRVVVSKTGEIAFVDEQADISFIGKVIGGIKAQIKTTFDEGFKSGSMTELALGGVVLLPVIGVIFSSLWSRFRSGEKNKLRSFSLILAGLLFLMTLVFGTFFSTDTFRWLTHTVMPLFTIFLFISYYEGDMIFEEIKRRFSFVNAPVLILFFMIYASLAPSD